MQKKIVLEISINELRQLLREELQLCLSEDKRSQNQSERKALYIGLKEAALFLGLAPSTIYNKTSKKQIPYYKPKGTHKLLFKKSDLIEYLERGLEDP